MSKFLLGLMLVAASPLALAVDDAAHKKVDTAIKALVPNAKIDSIADAKLPGFYEVVMGGDIVYVSGDGKYLFTGSLWDLGAKRDLTDARKADLRRSLLQTVGSDKRISFKAKDEKHKVTVFTDIDCGYCRRLHQQIADYNAKGISVDYLFFPRSGKNTESFVKAEAVWCAADRAEALTRAKAGETLDTKQCDNPIAEEFDLGLKIGVTGTPMVIAEDGTQIGGYLDPDAMAQRLEALKATN
jgi:thiol:disulfide interchange protein DsbC